MEARRKKGPLSPVWQAIRSKHKELTPTTGFTPDISKPISQYDQSVASYDKVIQDAEKIGAMLGDLPKAINANFVEYKAANENLHTLYQKGVAWPPHLLDLARGGNSAATVIARLEQHIATAEEVETKRKALQDRMSAVAMAITSYLKRFKDEYKSRNSGVDSAQKKLEAEASQLEDQIRQIALKYQQIALKQDMRKISDSIDDFLTRLR
jgi:DNA repair exonuclease SbcCD ATPase subunit